MKSTKTWICISYLSKHEMEICQLFYCQIRESPTPLNIHSEVCKWGSVRAKINDFCGLCWFRFFFVSWFLIIPKMANLSLRMDCTFFEHCWDFPAFDQVWYFLPLCIIKYKNIPNHLQQTLFHMYAHF